MQIGPFKAIQANVEVGNSVVTKRSIQIVGSPQCIGAQFLSLDIPEGVECKIVANGMYDKQKIVRFELLTLNGKTAYVDCPVMIDVLETGVTDG